MVWFRMGSEEFAEAYEAQVVGVHESFVATPEGVSERAFSDANAIYNRFAELVERYGAWDAGCFLADLVTKASEDRDALEGFVGDERELSAIAAILSPFRWSVGADGKVLFDRPPFEVAYREHLHNVQHEQDILAAADAEKIRQSNERYRNLPPQKSDDTAIIGCCLGWLPVLAFLVVVAAIVLWAVRYLLAAI